MNNYDIAEQFELLAKLMDIHGEDSFRAKSYASAAFNLERVEGEIFTMHASDLKAQRIGDSSIKKIEEIKATGTIKNLAILVDKTPQGILELLKIKGLGPKKINTIWKQLEIETPGELLYACNENRLTLYKGFGEKTQKNIKDALEFYFNSKDFYLLHQLQESLETITTQVSNIIKTPLQLCGNVAAQDNTVEAYEWVTTDTIEAIKNKFGADKQYKAIGAAGIEILNEQAPNFIFYNASNLGTTVFNKTSTPEFEAAFTERFGAIPNVADEAEIFTKAGLPFIPAYHRYSAACLDWYSGNSYKEIIGTNQVKGLIHNHSTWSDGLHSIEKMVQTAMADGFEYLVISDHSQAAAYAGGLSVERIKKQHEEINTLNQKYRDFKIFKSIECDILIDGALDYDETTLASFDVVIASVHSGLRMPEEKAMERLMNAIKNPFTNILGHMTGRLLLSRPGYAVNHEKIFEACAAHNVVVELNAHPRRLDVDYTQIPLALKHGVKISINPDAHFVEGFKDVYWGSIAARKGGLLTTQNLSSHSLAEFNEWLLPQQQKRNIN
jgi:DNA polymerase (family X)